MKRLKGLKEVRTLGKIIQEKKLQDLKINIEVGDPSRRASEKTDTSPPVRTWVFSEKPSFQRYQPLYQKKSTPEKKIEIQKIKEPEVSVFKNVHEIKVVAELPGTVEAEIHLEVFDDILVIETRGEFQGKNIHYYKEILLPFAVEAKIIDSSFTNGVLEVTLQKKERRAHEKK